MYKKFMTIAEMRKTSTEDLQRALNRYYRMWVDGEPGAKAAFTKAEKVLTERNESTMIDVNPWE